MQTVTQEPKTRSAGAVRVDRLRPNGWNKARPLDEAFVTSIKARGILSPLRVREVDPDVEGRDLEIICGERRWRAAVEAGLEYVPAVTLASSDEDAQTDTLIENTHRTGFSPWQEAEAVGELLGKGMDVEAISAATGWSVATVRRRAKLLEVSPSWRQAVEGGDLHNWTIQHFEVLAGFDAKFQEGLWKRIENRATSFSVADLKEEIASESQTLKAAPWDLDDVTLSPRAGACVGCVKRSDTQADMFGDAHGASCLDGECFAAKLKAHGKRKEAELLEKHPEAVKVTSGYGQGAKGALKPHEYTEAKKSDKGAVPAIIHGADGKVSLIHVKVKKKTVEKEPTEKDLAKEAEKKHQARITALAIEKLLALVRDPTTKFHADAWDVLLMFCLVYGAELQIDDDKQAARVRAYKKKVTTAELWAAALPELDRGLNQAKWALVQGFGKAEENPAVELAAWLVDADFAALRREAEVELAQVPAPDPNSAPDGHLAGDEGDEGWDNVEGGR